MAESEKMSKQKTKVAQVSLISVGVEHLQEIQFLFSVSYNERDNKQVGMHIKHKAVRDLLILLRSKVI